MKDRECCMVLRVVVVAQAAVAGEPGGHALVAAVHGHQVDVHVDQEVRGGGPLVDLDVLALVGLAQVDQVVGVLGVVLGQKAVGGEGVVDPVAQGVAQLGLGHPAVQRQGGDQHDVVDAGLGRQVEHVSMTIWRASGASMGGSGSEMSSKQIVSLMPGRSSAGSGSRSPSGCSSAWRMAP